MSENTEVVVIGGGYAGVAAADRLARQPDVAVTLINPRPTFVERIRLHQLVAGTHAAVVGFDAVLAAPVRLVVDTAVRIDRSGRSVVLASGDTVGYDYLVYAVGSTGTDRGVPGAARFACAGIVRRLAREARRASRPPIARPGRERASV
jgi:NADH:quinone reductase (non-electrogenic)